MRTRVNDVSGFYSTSFFWFQLAENLQYNIVVTTFKSFLSLKDGFHIVKTNKGSSKSLSMFSSWASCSYSSCLNLGNVCS